MFKRIGSFLLALALCLSMVPQAGRAAQEVTGYVVPLEAETRVELNLAGSKVPTEAEAYQAMIALKDEYYEGRPWTNANFYDWNGGIFSGGGGCAGFAFILSDAAFGSLPARQLYAGEFAYEDIRVGDILRVNYDTHSVVVMETHDDHVVLAEGNFNSSIHWGRTMTKSEVMSTTVYIMTRYPEQTQTPEEPTIPEEPSELNDAQKKAYQALVAMQATYPEGSVWDDDTQYPGSAHFNRVWGEQAFAYILSDAAFGDTPVRTYYPQAMLFREIQVGDIVRCGWSFYVVMEAHADHLVVACLESDTTQTKVSWNKTLTKAEVMEEFAMVHTRYPGTRYVCGENLTWSLDDQGTLTISGTGEMVDRNLNAADFEQYRFRWEMYLDRIQTLVVEEGVTTIGAEAFSDCPNLTKVVLPSSLTTIGNDAFADCTALEEITLPDSVTKLESGIFTRCTSLKKAKLSDSLTKLGEQLFYGCTSLTEVSLPTGLRVLSNQLFYGCTSLTQLTIPNSVGSIEYQAFSESGIREITVPGGVTVVMSEAFSQCESLTRVTLPDTLQEIGNHAFRYCTSLTDINLPNSITDIGERAFEGCASLTRIVLPQGMTKLEEYMFVGCTSLAEVVIPDSVTTIDDCTFWECTSLKTLVLPENLTRLGGSLFWDCTALTELTIPKNVTYFGDYSFQRCTALETITFLGDAPQFAADLWGNVVHFPDLTITIYYPKDNPTWTEEVRQNYGGNVTWVAMDAAEEKPPVTTQVVASGNCSSTATWTLDSEGTLTVSGTGDMPDVRRPRWYDYLEDIKKVEIGSGITNISHDAFAGCTNLTSVTIPDSVTSICENAFSGCTSLTGITIPDSITSISDSVFSGCTGLTGITIPDSVTSIGGGAFTDCTSLTGITIPDSVTSIGGVAFYGCTSLTSITIPDGVTSIADRIFYDCTGLTSITLPDSVTRIESYAFTGCTGLTGITIPGSVAVMEYDAFYGCTGLTSITFLGDAPRIGENCFYGVTAAASYPKDNPTWTEARLSYGGRLTWAPIGEEDVQPPVEQPPTEPEQPPVTTEVVASGKAENMTWSLDKNGKLTISGTGDMPYCTMEAQVPWYPYMQQITSVVIEKGITSVGPYAFHRCLNLETVSIPEGVTVINKDAFNTCTSLKAVTIPDSVTTIGLRAFNLCEKLETLNLGKGVQELQNYAFDMCRALTEITIPASVTKLNNHTFASCDELAVIHFEGNMPQFSGDVFSGSGYLSDIICYYPANNATWQNMGSYGARLKWVVEGTCLHSQTKTANAKAATCTEPGYTGDTLCAACETLLSSGSETPALGHSFQNGSCTTCGQADPNWKDPSQKVELLRGAGSDRFETAFLAAVKMRDTLGIEKFDTVVVASGMDFADALSGSYLAAVKQAPILLACNVGWINDMVKDQIKALLKPGGTVYILGGEKAIPASFATGLESFNVKRLAGSNRFETNLKVLDEAGVGDKPILVCTGGGFADSLSASATKLPILLVYGDKLLSGQDTFLESVKGRNLYIIGGTSAVSAKLEAKLDGYGTVERVAGNDRFSTSVQIARKFFDNPDTAVLAYGANFPDGLCGGPLAAVMDAPLILTMQKFEQAAADYVQSKQIKKGIVLGGEKLIPDASANDIFGM